MLAWLERRGGSLADYVFPSRTDHARPLSTRQYARLVAEWGNGIGLRREECGTHSLRRTKASIIYKASGNLRAVQICSATPRLRIPSATLASMSKVVDLVRGRRGVTYTGFSPL
ncbi:tyrosine-type recombinase/integrase [Sphingomonas sp. CFBP 8765]|uniref:tyrosine-type recombinase/integrase n=1 Tax=Sphingomonas sp. CFBP 8765 TaxID=2775274 RepID=UPI00406CE8C9